MSVFITGGLSALTQVLPMPPRTVLEKSFHQNFIAEDWHKFSEDGTEVEERAGDYMLSVTVWSDICHELDENDSDE